MRRHVSLLLDHGHPYARHYPLGALWDESTLVRQRVNGDIKTHMAFMQMVVGSVLSKKAGEALQKHLNGLDSGE